MATTGCTADRDRLATRRLTWALEAYARCAKALIRANSLPEMADQVCQAIVAREEYPLAAIVMIDPQTRTLRRIGEAGRAVAYIEAIEISLDSAVPQGRGPGGTALRTGIAQVMDDVMTSGSFGPWRERAECHGIRSNVVAPFSVDGEVVGAVLVYSLQPHAFTAREVGIFSELGEELAFAMTVLRNKELLHVAQAAQHAAEAELQVGRNELARIARAMALGEFAASLAHEIAQPLTATITNIEAAQRYLTMEPARVESAATALGRALRDADRATGVVHTTRRQLQREPVALAHCDINAMVKGVVGFLEAGLAQDGVRVRTQLTSGLPPVMASKVQLPQVLVNLITNGRDAMRDNGERPRLLEIATGRDTAGAIELTVTDNGAGIDEAAAGRLFEHFFTTKHDGVGLGLAISRGIIETHGGRIGFEPGPHGGTRFRIVLPPADHAEHREGELSDVA